MKVAIAGYAQEGKAACKYYLDKGHTVTVLDDDPKKAEEVPDGVEFLPLKENLDKLHQYDIVSRTPVIPPKMLKDAKNLTSVTKEFFKVCPCPIIAVTGTKGKGTTASLITDILRNCGKGVYLVGNIGKPALEVLDKLTPDSLVVYEISSFQLWDMDQSPHIAVITMLTEEHLDIHDSMEDYLEAKSNITKHQSKEDLVVYHPSNKLVQQMAELSPGKKVKFLSNEGANVKQGKIAINEQEICSVDDIKLLGTHNLANVAAAVTVSLQYCQDITKITEAVTNFEALEHRLEFVEEKQGRKFYNDSYSTAPLATGAALEAIGSNSIFIMGGYDKKAHFKELADYVMRYKPRHVLLIGETADRIAESFKQQGYEDYTITTEKQLEGIVKQAISFSQQGDSIVLSPACASFDMFDNYKQRGKIFKKIVSKL